MEGSEIKELYELVVSEDWITMEKELCKKAETSIMRLLTPISMHNDNIIHLAVHSKKKEPLGKILELVKDDINSFTSAVNAYGNTVLHEAAICRNLEAVKLLVETNKKLIEMKNDSGETPLFRAAAFGNTKILKFLAAQDSQRVTSSERMVQLKSIHRKKEDGTSILCVAIQGRHFGTALELLKLDESLAVSEDKNENSLYVLAKIPIVFKMRYQMGIWEKLLWFCIPIGYGQQDGIESITEKEDQDIETGLRKAIPAGSHHAVEIEGGKGGLIYEALYKIYLSIWYIIIIGWPSVNNIWEEKRKYEFACKLAQTLIEKDKSWERSNTKFVYGDGPPAVENKEEEEPGNPLFTAIRTGNIELVKLILEKYPQALEQINHNKQNILHLAAMYRQKEIFDYVKEKEIPMLRLARQIDVNGYTVLHSVADTKHYKGGKRSGPAYQLLEELKWFKDVEEKMPSYYTMLHANNKKTPWDVFEEMHDKQYKDAQQWIKDTSQSCSAVAVLVATVVFAAAFTVPGGNNDANGRPILINNPFFLFFTIADIISLSCSLTAVVMFLAVLTSPFELENFLDKLPRNLTLGFALLFLSVATTMLAFASTIFLIIRLDERRRWTTTLICCASFFPVSVLALTHFPLFGSFVKAWNFLFMKLLPGNLVRTFLKYLKKRVMQPPQSKDKVKR